MRRRTGDKLPLTTRLFLERFAQGKYKQRRFGLYKIFDRDEITGDRWDCQVLMFRPAERTSGTVDMPYPIGIRLGKKGEPGVLIRNKESTSYQWGSRSDCEGTRYLRHGDVGAYGTNLMRLHGDVDITESRLIELREHQPGPREAVVDIGGRYFLLTSIGKRKEKLSVRDWLFQHDGSHGKVLPNRPIPLAGKVKSIREAWESLIPTQAKNTPGSFHWQGLWYVPSNVVIPSVDSEEVRGLRAIYAKVPLPGLFGIPMGVFNDKSLFTMSLHKDEVIEETKESLSNYMGDHQASQYLAIVQRWSKARKELREILWTTGLGRQMDNEIKAASGYVYEAPLFRQGLYKKDGSTYFMGLIGPDENEGLKLTKVHELIAPICRVWEDID